MFHKRTGAVEYLNSLKINHVQNFVNQTERSAGTNQMLSCEKYTLFPSCLCSRSRNSIKGGLIVHLIHVSLI